MGDFDHVKIGDQHISTYLTDSTWSMVIISYHNDIYNVIQLIGLREKLQENPMIFMGESMVSG